MESDGMLWNVGLGECITSCITCMAWELLVIKYLSGLGVSKYIFPFFGHQAATNTLEVLKNDLPCHALQQNVTFNCPTVKCQTSIESQLAVPKCLDPKNPKLPFTEA